LAVDDETAILELIQFALEDVGFRVTAAASGREAIALIEADRARNFDGLVTDVNLGRAPSGWEVARLARALNPAIPVIYTSGDSAHEWTRNGVPRSLLLQKPFAPSGLGAALARLIETAQADA
jgi:CheY-like chemotaxis protein